MPRLRRPDGAELEWWIEGRDGPLVAIAMMAFHPTLACHGIAHELARDHRVLRYDLRGTGASTLTPPYDIETDAADLAALVEEAGVPRLRAWIEDESLAYGRALGDRLWYLHYPGNLWFQGSIEIVRRSLPDARLEAVSEGVISSPVENAKTIRRILAGHEAAA